MLTILKSKMPNADYVVRLDGQLAKFRNLRQGQLAPEIQLQNPKGESFSLSQLRGKWVLIDFWASWCKPCRAESPKMVKLYNAYKGKPFEILGVSLDSRKNDWIMAISNDKYTWPQVSDLRGWQSAAAKTYQVTGIPFTVLVNPEGKIHAKGLRGEQLEKTLAEVLN
jgi:peroxiredoxin